MAGTDSQSDSADAVKPKVTYRRSPNGRYDGSESDRDATPTQIVKPPARTKILPTNSNPIVNNNPRSNTVANPLKTVTEVDRSMALNLAFILVGWLAPGYIISRVIQHVVFLPVSMEWFANIIGAQVIR